jgi:hypothetical protein
MASEYRAQIQNLKIRLFSAYFCIIRFEKYIIYIASGSRFPITSSNATDAQSKATATFVLGKQRPGTGF